MRGFFVIAMVLFSSAHCFAQFSQGPFSPSNAYLSVVGGSLASWQNLDSIYVSDDERVSLTANLSTNGSYSNFLVVDGFNFSIPLGVNTDGIQVDVERSDGNGLSKDNIVRMVGASGNILTVDRAKTAAWTATDTYLSYGSSSDTWGRTWVPYEINDPDYGFAISVQRSGGGVQYPVGDRSYPHDSLVFGFCNSHRTALFQCRLDGRSCWFDLGYRYREE